MPINYPFYPQFPPRPYMHYPQSINHQKSNSSTSTNRPNHKQPNNFYNNSTNYYKKEKMPTSTETASSNNNDDDNSIFEIFGIKLHSDDILLICLIFFLYKEGVKDEYLFISLILLLLS